MTITVEHDHRVNKMFKRLWPSDAPLFRDMANEDYCRPSCSRNAREHLRTPPNLANTPRGSLKLCERGSLNGVNNQQRWTTALCRLCNGANLALGEDLNTVSSNGSHEAEPFGAIGDLCRRLFA